MEKMRPLTWLGNSLDNLKEFPDDVQKSIGDDLQVVQWGSTPRSAKHFKGVGSGVYEIVESHDTNTYRAVYAVKLGKRVYVLHAFQKKSKIGITKRLNPMLNSFVNATTWRLRKRRKKKMNEENIEIYEGSGNVFADLGLEDAEELYTRAKIGFQVLTILQDRKLKQKEVATLLNIKQAEVSLLMRGRFHHFSTERLLNFLKKLDQEVTLLICNRNASDKRQGVVLSL
jgi:phage-related protein/predicted XRE-type DNA-binding protein